MLRNKKIIIGVCGSIAAYKSAFLVRLLVKSGAEVQVVTTQSALDFITPLTLSTLSKNPVLSTFTKGSSGEWNNHVDLGLWADAMVVAPASANTISKMANGVCDNLLLATYLSARCPVFYAPAMDLDMFQHPSTKANIEKLSTYGNHLIHAEHGELASGLTGVGRMAEPEKIVEALSAFFSKDQPLNNKRVLITAGPTYEAIDPVRFIGNHSSGKMGYAIAEVMAEKGASVELVSGPSYLNPIHQNIKLTKVQSAKEMYQACLTSFDTSDICILSAAVADYTPAKKADQKIKKSTDSMSIDLIQTKDIAAELGQKKKSGQVIVGFALETENEEQNALQKIKKKNFDFIVLNSLNDKGAGFGHDTNKITILDVNNNKTEFKLKKKSDVAQDIVNRVIETIQ